MANQNDALTNEQRERMLAGLPHDAEISMTEMEAIDRDEDYKSMLRRFDRTIEMVDKADEIRRADACDRAAVAADAKAQIAGLPSRGLQRDMELRRLAKTVDHHIAQRLMLELDCLLLASYGHWLSTPDPDMTVDSRHQIGREYQALVQRMEGLGDAHS